VREEDEEVKDDGNGALIEVVNPQQAYL